MIKRIVFDVGNAVGNRDTGYAASPKIKKPDPGHRETVDCAWDCHNVVGARVSGYGDRAVRDRVIELGLHCERRGQEQPAKKEQRLPFKSGHQFSKNMRFLDVSFHLVRCSVKFPVPRPHYPKPISLIAIPTASPYNRKNVKTLQVLLFFRGQAQY